MDSMNSQEHTQKRFEMRCGVTIAIFAAILAVSDLFGGKFGDDEIKAVNERSAAYLWYQSKSIKETILEGQRDLLQSLKNSGSLSNSHSGAIDQHVSRLNEEIDRYSQEKKEILLGSAKVGPQNWVQEVDGQLGKVKGAKEFDLEVEVLAAHGDRLDFSSLFLQLCLVMGAISLVLGNPRGRQLFYGLMLALGTVGVVYAVSGLV